MSMWAVIGWVLVGWCAVFVAAINIAHFYPASEGYVYREADVAIGLAMYLWSCWKIFRAGTKEGA